MVKKIVVLIWIFSFFLFLSFNLFLSVFPNYAKQEKWQIRILLASQKKQIVLSSEESFILHLQGLYTISQQELLIVPLKEKNTFKNGFLSIVLQQNNSLIEAIAFAKKTRDQYFKESSTQFLIQEKSPEQFTVSIGLYENAKETDFMIAYLSPFIPGMKTNYHEASANAIGVQLEKNIFLFSNFTYTQKAFKGLSLTCLQSPCQYEKISYPDTLQLFLENDTLSLVNQTDMETYLQGVVGSEMPDDWPMEALKAQTLASRTYAYSRCLSAMKRNAYFDVTNDTNSQVYLGIRNLPNSGQAIKATEGLILTCQSKPIESVFHSSSGGYTENNEYIWSGSPTPYLRGVPSPGEEISPHFSWYRTFTKSTVIDKLNAFLLKKQLPKLSSDEFELTITEKGVSPRVRKITLSQEDREYSISGSEFVSLFSLKSTWFDFYWVSQQTEKAPPLLQYYFKQQQNKIAKEPILNIFGRGWGHGVGMSQYGALAMARKGYTYKDIVSHFYQSTNIESIPSNEIQNEKMQTLQNQILFEPCCTQVQLGAYLDVIIKINSQASVFGVSFEMQYPKNLIELKKEDIREGTFLKSDLKSTIYLVSESEKGYKIGLSREGKVGGVSGEGDLLFFRFQGKQIGMFSIKLIDFQALDSRLEPIAFQVQTMEITIYQKDVSPPITKIVRTPARLSNQRKVTFEWSGDDNQTLPAELLYSYRLNQEPWSAFSYVTNVSLTLISDGDYVFSVQAKDKEGNTELDPPVYHFTLDTTPPILEIAESPVQTNLAEYTLNGQTESEVTVMMNGKFLEIMADGSFSVTVPLVMGTNSFQFIAMDRATNSTIKEIKINRQEFQPIIITMNIGSKKAIVDDNILTLDSAPFIKQDRTFVPLRFIAEAFGAKVQWFPETKKIEIQLNHPLVKKNILLWVDKTTAYVNNTAYSIDVAPFIVPPGRTVVPIRFIAEAMESKVEWFAITQTIKITFPGVLMNENSVNSNLGGIR